MNLTKNAVFACDALTLLERIPSESATLVYLDPPWGMELEREHSYSKSSGDRGSEYLRSLSMVLQHAQRILTKNGSLFVHWTSKSPLDIRLVGNQAFRESPKYEITWRRIMHSFGGGPKIDSEFFLVYSKSDDLIYNTKFLPLSEQDKSLYSKQDWRGRFRVDSLTSSLNRPRMQFEWRGWMPPPNRSWRYAQEKLEEFAAEDRIYFPQSVGFPGFKRYLDENVGRELTTTWDDIPSIPRREGRRAIYPGESPLPLMVRIVELASNAGDLVLDPFCGSGTTLIAAQQVGRRWLGADNSVEAQTTTLGRLTSLCGLVAPNDYTFATQADVEMRPVVEMPYREVVTNIREVSELQRETAALTGHLVSLKRLMNIGENDDERVEKAIEQMQHWIATSVANQAKSVDSYIPLVCSWLVGWEKLDKASQFFLPQAELLFDNIAKTNSQDYSPFIIQYCRALENELLIKLFRSYAGDLYGRRQDFHGFLVKDAANNKTGKFAKSLQKRDNNYTLGDMNFIMGLMKENGKTLQESELLQDFRSFTIHYFSERIVDKSYLEQIEAINKDFRCKAAHPYILDAEVAERCRQQVRSCLNELILNYRGGDNGLVG